MAYSEPTHPPLFRPGLHPIAIEALEETFLPPELDTPLRRRLTTQLRLFVGRLAGLGVHGDIWINGSYATKKPDPRDVDLLLLVSPAALRVPTPEDMTTLKRYMTRDGRSEIRSKWQVDFYVADTNSAAERDYWQDWLSRNPDQSNRKGIPFVTI